MDESTKVWKGRRVVNQQIASSGCGMVRMDEKNGNGMEDGSEERMDRRQWVELREKDGKGESLVQREEIEEVPRRASHDVVGAENGQLASERPLSHTVSSHTSEV